MKTYVISDVHGLGAKFTDFLRILDPEDIVYVLRDVIDRGPDGIQILQYIMNHPDQFKMILGNHEHMILTYLEAARRVDFEKASYMNHEEINYLYDRWAIRNQGIPTLEYYEKIPKEQQEQIYQFIKNLPVAYTNVKIKNYCFYLVHSMPKELKKDVVYQQDLPLREDLHQFIWKRPSFPETCHIDDKIVISGHTITIKYHDKLEIYFSKDKEGNIRYIDIDCGCAMNCDDSKLACLCLDDMSVQYF